MQDAKEEVRARLNIEDVVGEYVQLKRAGRNFKGLSPFTSERTPSFVVSPDKHIWHDFSSGKGGDVFSFVMEVEGVDFRQALEQLARRAGVDLSLYQSKSGGDIAKKKRRLQEATELATRYYQQSLVHNEHAARYVFSTRGLSKEIVQTFRIGYAPSAGHALVEFLRKKGFTDQELQEAGLTNRFGGDLFRGRMMVPLMDGSGQVVGFTARILDDEPNAPKYLNTPQTLLYDKSWHVFGLSQAKEAIRKQGYTVVVEGNLDVVSSHQVGVSEVVATAGTAMTEHHLRSLSRLSGSVRLAFDADKAGLAATERAIPIAQQVGVDLAIVSLPGDAKDPDELIQQDVDLWQQAITAAEPVIDWLLKQYQAREDLQVAAGKRAYTTAGLRLVAQLHDPVDQDHYLQIMAKTTGASLEALRQKLAQITANSSASDTPVKRVNLSRSPVSIDESETLGFRDDLLAALLYDPATRTMMDEVTAELFSGERQRAVAQYLVSAREPVNDTPPQLQKYDTYVKILLLRADNRYATWTDQDRTREVAQLLRQLITEHNKDKRDQLIAKIHDAETEGNDALADSIRTELNTLIKEIKHG